ncbi:MAG: tetratricopeptide repeat protein, partial [Chloroflexi bacterium]|nr:tetratricopeptide repeat protein [Chloroflexota bacterium]
SLPYVVMEYLHGLSLHDKPPADLNETLRVTLQICDALEEAHIHGIVHRDLKPENVIITDGGLIKLTDFGLARSLSSRMSQEAALTGTVFYISPEQALGRPLDGRTDLYSLGVMLYEFTTGQLPFTADDPLAVIAQHIHEQPRRPIDMAPDIPPVFEEIILKLLSKKVEDRFSTANELKEALTDLSAGAGRFLSAKQKNQFTADLTRFIGREREIDEVKELLKQHRLVTLTGVGGTGKTRLSLQVAREMQDDFSDGVWVVELSTIFEKEQVIRVVAAALDVREKTNQPLMESIVEFLKPRELLLIMDNCEHLITTCAGFCGMLLGACPDIRIMVTSREALGIQGEVSFHVPSMKLPDLESLPEAEAVWEVESMQLFMDRAASVNPDFSPSREDTLAVARICSRLDGIPLAIELAAARVRALPVEEIANRLSDRFRLLTGGIRTAMPRQQTLQALIDWSFDLITEQEKLLLQRMSVFSGGSTLEAVEKICSNGGIDEADILDLITRLVDKSLVTFENMNGAARYDMLETIRQYAREKLIQAGEIEFLRRRHLEYFTGFTEKIAPELWRGEQVRWMDRLEQEHDNLRVALEWSLCGECGPDLLIPGMRIAGAISLFWLVRGHWSEAWTWMRRLMENNDAVDLHDPVKTRLLYAAGFIVESLGDIHKSKKLFEQAVQEARTQQDTSGHAYALLGLGEIAINEHSVEEAEKLIEQSLLIFKSLDDKVGMLLAYTDKGKIAADSQGYDMAREYFNENLKICRELGHQLGVAGTLLALGQIETHFGDKDKGRKLVEESLSIYRVSKDKSGIAGALSAIGLSELYAENMESSREHYEQALHIARELRSGPSIGTALIALGEIARSQSDYAAARDYYEEALHLNEHLGQLGIVNIVAHNLGYVAKHQGDLNKALEYFRKSLSMSQERDQRRLLFFCLAGIASVLVDVGEHHNAAKLFAFSEKFGRENHYHLDPVDNWEVDQSIKKLDQELDQKEIARNRESGEKLTLEEAIQFAKGAHEN